MNQIPIILKNRSLISISGEDRKIFLQGLITNDINKANENQAIYSLLLSPQGRFLYDFFIIEKGQKLLLDCDVEKIDEIIQKLSFYKLRSKVLISKEPDLKVLSIVGEFDPQQFMDQIIFTDPRNSNLGFRVFSSNSQNTSSETGEILYNFHRLNLKIPDDSDLTFDKSFPLEFGFDNLNAIDYKKGCYVGQETTARTHYKGVIRKKIFLVELENEQIKKGDEIEGEGKKIGEILSSIKYKNKLSSLALIKNLDNEGREVNLEAIELKVADTKIKLIK